MILVWIGGVFKKVSTRIELPDGRKVFGKQINNNPEEYFTEDILHQLDIAAGVEFKYGQGNDTAEVEEELENAEV